MIDKRLHKYKLTDKQFDRIIARTSMKAQTKTVLRRIFVKGWKYEAAGAKYCMSKQFIRKKVERIKGICTELDINYNK